MTDNVFLPLDGFPFFHAREPEPARAVLTDVLGAFEIDSIGRPASFDWQVNRVELGPLALFSGRMRGGWRIQGEPWNYLLVLPRAGQAQLVQRHGEAELLPGKTACIISTATPTNWRVETEVSSLAIRIPPPFLEAQLEALTGVTPGRPLSFAPRLAAEAGAGASLARLLRFLVGEVEQRATLFEHPVIAAGISEAVVRGLLVGQRHSASHLFEKRARGAGPRCVRLLEEYMEAHAAQPVRMAELATLAGTTVRSIQAAFRAHRGYSPMAFLRAKRMELALRAFLSPLPFTTVTSVAYACGFLQPGQFSVDYRKRFGESPSRALRRGRSLVGHGAATALPLRAGRVDP